ncbi:hypothetical protein ABW19_dt0208122 [Dactylella cylindrospora]|nr:hypothetical protein ABW19_dt0208122 [Dactylella cylindrospora]
MKLPWTWNGVINVIGEPIGLGECNPSKVPEEDPFRWNLEGEIWTYDRGKELNYWPTWVGNFTNTRTKRCMTYDGPDSPYLKAEGVADSYAFSHIGGIVSKPCDGSDSQKFMLILEPRYVGPTRSRVVDVLSGTPLKKLPDLSGSPTVPDFRYPGVSNFHDLL